MEAKENTSEQGNDISRQDSNESNSTEGSDNKVHIFSFIRNLDKHVVLEVLNFS